MDRNLVEKAVGALQTHHTTLQGKGKPKLLEENPVVSLIIALKKIPNKTIRPYRIPLPYTLYPLEDTEMCLITKDTKPAVKTLLEEKQVHGVTKVIPVAKLKTNYKSYELKRRLSSSYDLFLTDKRLYHMLPRLLGKKFFEKKKFPFPVDLQKKDLALEINRARDASYLHIGLGSCCSVPVGKIGFPGSHLCENVSEAMKGIVSRIPRGWRNIQSVHIKSVDSISLPLYNSLPPEPQSLPSVEEGPKVKRVKLVEESTNMKEEEFEVKGSIQQAKSALKRRSVTPVLSVKKVRGSTVVVSTKKPGRQKTLH